MFLYKRLKLKKFQILEKKTYFYQKIAIFLQALVQKQQKIIRTCYIAQKKRLGLCFHAHFNSGQKNKNWTVWQPFYKKIAIFWQKYVFFFKNLKFFQLQALVQKQRKIIRTCYIAQKKRPGLCFHAHFNSGQKKNKIEPYGNLFMKK